MSLSTVGFADKSFYMPYAFFHATTTRGPMVMADEEPTKPKFLDIKEQQKELEQAIALMTSSLDELYKVVQGAKQYATEAEVFVYRLEQSILPTKSEADNDKMSGLTAGITSLQCQIRDLAKQTRDNIYGNLEKGLKAYEQSVHLMESFYSTKHNIPQVALLAEFVKRHTKQLEELVGRKDLFS